MTRRAWFGLALFAALVAWVLVPAPHELVASVHPALDADDGRPARHVLFIGNSHTFTHDVPGMVRRVADSAGFRERLVLTVHAGGGLTLMDHWNNPATHAVIASRRWRHIVIQGGGPELLFSDIYEERAARFREGGERLVALARQHSEDVVLYVTWFRAAGGYNNSWWLDGDDGGRKPADQVDFNRELTRMHQDIQAGYTNLARSTGARLSNVGAAWWRARGDAPGVALHQADGNHATPAGAYLAAMVLGQTLVGTVAGQVTWAPEGIPSGDAALLRRVAGQD